MGSAWIRQPDVMGVVDLANVMALIDPIVKSQRGRITIEELIEDHREKRCDIWATRDDDGTIRSVCIARVKEYRTGLRILLMQFGAGHMTDFYDKMWEAEDVARRCRCHRIQVSGRPGWKRALAKLGDPGWSEVSRTIEKEVAYDG